MITIDWYTTVPNDKEMFRWTDLTIRPHMIVHVVYVDRLMITLSVNGHLQPFASTVLCFVAILGCKNQTRKISRVFFGLSGKKLIISKRKISMRRYIWNNEPGARLILVFILYDKNDFFSFLAALINQLDNNSRNINSTSSWSLGQPPGNIWIFFWGPSSKTWF